MKKKKKKKKQKKEKTVCCMVSKARATIGRKSGCYDPIR